MGDESVPTPAGRVLITKRRHKGRNPSQTETTPPGTGTGTRLREGTMVWGKVKSHPWWPGQIFNPAFASATAKRCRRTGHLLVAFFGDATFGWFTESNLVPLEPTFDKKSAQTLARSFREAVDDAVEDLARRAALGLLCDCFPFRVPSPRDGFFRVSVPGYDSSVIYPDWVITESRDAFRPQQMLAFLKKLAVAPLSGIHTQVSGIKSAAQVKAYRSAVSSRVNDEYLTQLGFFHTRDKSSEPLNQGTVQGALSQVFGNGKEYAVKGKKSSIRNVHSKDRAMYLKTNIEDDTSDKEDKYLFKRREVVDNEVPFSSTEAMVNTVGDEEVKEHAIVSQEEMEARDMNKYVFQKRIEQGRKEKLGSEGGYKSQKRTLKTEHSVKRKASEYEGAGCNSSKLDSGSDGRVMKTRKAEIIDKDSLKKSFHDRVLSTEKVEDVLPVTNSAQETTSFIAEDLNSSLMSSNTDKSKEHRSSMSPSKVNKDPERVNISKVRSARMSVKSLPCKKTSTNKVPTVITHSNPSDNVLTGADNSVLDSSNDIGIHGVKRQKENRLGDCNLRSNRTKNHLAQINKPRLVEEDIESLTDQTTVIDSSNIYSLDADKKCISSHQSQQEAGICSSFGQVSSAHSEAAAADHHDQGFRSSYPGEGSSKKRKLLAKATVSESKGMGDIKSKAEGCRPKIKKAGVISDAERLEARNSSQKLPLLHQTREKITKKYKEVRRQVRNSTHSGSVLHKDTNKGEEPEVAEQWMQTNLSVMMNNTEVIAESKQHCVDHCCEVKDAEEGCFGKDYDRHQSENVIRDKVNIDVSLTKYAKKKDLTNKKKLVGTAGPSMKVEAEETDMASQEKELPQFVSHEKSRVKENIHNKSCSSGHPENLAKLDSTMSVSKIREAISIQKESRKRNFAFTESSNKLEPFQKLAKSDQMKPELAKSNSNKLVGKVENFRKGKMQEQKKLKCDESLKAAEEPMALSMKFPVGFAIPSEAQLKARFVRFGQLDVSGTRVYYHTRCAKVVFRYSSDAEAAYHFALSNNLFGHTNVTFRLKKINLLKKEDEKPVSNSANQNGSKSDSNVEVCHDKRRKNKEEPLVSLGKNAVDLQPTLQDDESGELISVTTTYEVEKMRAVEEVMGIPLEEAKINQTEAVKTNIPEEANLRQTEEAEFQEQEQPLSEIPSFQLKSCLRKPDELRRNSNKESARVTFLLENEPGFNQNCKKESIPPISCPKDEFLESSSVHVSIMEETNSPDISLQMLHLLRKCSVIINDVRSLAGFVPYY